MNPQKDNNIFLGRRNFVLAMFMIPFVISKLTADIKTEAINPLFSNNEDGFVILDGWVLLKDDLIGHQN